MELSRMPVADVSVEIQNMFENNKLEDLKRFMNKRKCLNDWNMVFVYMFHVVQSAGILTTTIAAGYDMKQLVWIGVGLNVIAALINVFEKTNNSISKHLLKDIQAIKNGTFVDEGTSVETDSKDGDKNTTKEQLLPAST